MNWHDPASESLFVRPRQNQPWLTWLACAACVAVFIGIHTDSSGGRADPVEKWGWQPTGSIYDGAYWSLFSTVFVHIEIWHLAFNLYWLYHLGRWLERAVGSWRWAAFFASAAFVSSAAELAVSGQTGIGASGVGYALFGFTWLLRKHVPSLADIIDQRTVAIFLIWLVGCVVLTWAGILHVANAAHFGGLLFGMAVAVLVLDKPRRLLISTAIALMIGVCITTLLWAPWSMEWTTWRGLKAHKHGDFTGAIRWYERSRKLGQDKKWCDDAIEMAKQAMLIDRFRRYQENGSPGQTNGSR